MKQLNFFIVLVIFSASAQAADIVANTGGSTGGMNYSCDANTLWCECKGVWNGADCKFMREKNCPDADSDCPDNLEVCRCTALRVSNTAPRPIATLGKQLVAPLKKKSTLPNALRPKIKVMSPAKLSPNQRTVAPTALPAKRKVMNPLKSPSKMKTMRATPTVKSKLPINKARVHLDADLNEANDLVEAKVMSPAKLSPNQRTVAQTYAQSTTSLGKMNDKTSSAIIVKTVPQKAPPYVHEKNSTPLPKTAPSRSSGKFELLAPSSLSVDTVTPTTVTLSWFDNSDREYGVEVYRMDPVEARRNQAVNWVFIGLFEERDGSSVRGTGQRSDEDYDLNPDTNYCYKLRSYVGFDRSVVSDHSKLVCTKTKASNDIPAATLTRPAQLNNTKPIVSVEEEEEEMEQVNPAAKRSKITVKRR